MKIIHSPAYDINVGLLRFLHPFDGRKFTKVHAALAHAPHLELTAPAAPVDGALIDGFVNQLLRRLIRSKRYVLQALEVPYLPLLPFATIDRRILLPMRWGVAGTLHAAALALDGEPCRNLSGGYHHASRTAAQGFCIYNDVGIAYDHLRRTGRLTASDPVLIIDVDAHHGNGNAAVFMEDPQITLLDAYNHDIYPQSRVTRSRVDIAIPLRSGTGGSEYLQKLHAALRGINGCRLAFVIAGTDVLAGDRLGRLNLSVAECAQRDRLIAERLRAASIPFVFLGGGGYSALSTRAMIAGITAMAAH